MMKVGIMKNKQINNKNNNGTINVCGNKNNTNRNHKNIDYNHTDNNSNNN